MCTLKYKTTRNTTNFSRVQYPHILHRVLGFDNIYDFNELVSNFAYDAKIAGVADSEEDFSNIQRDLDNDHL